jgi:hypothetical protein
MQITWQNLLTLCRCEMIEKMKTNYTIKQEGERLSVYLNNRLVSRGFMTEEDALHSIWCLEGKKPNDFYVVHEGVVALIK